jgi:hypothetical protein
MPQLKMRESKTRSKFYEKALESGLKRYSATMQWVSSPIEAESGRSAIYTIDNIAFIYALFASKKADNIVMACRHLSALLPFANSEGFFPDYLHQYPNSQGLYTSLHVHHTLALIMKYFAGVIPQTLKAAVIACQEKGQKTMLEKRDLLEGESFKKALLTVLCGEGEPEYMQALDRVPTSQDQLLYLFMLHEHVKGVDIKSYLSQHYDFYFERPLSGDYPMLLEGSSIYNDLPHYLINYYRLEEKQLTDQEDLLLRSALFKPFNEEIELNEPKALMVESIDSADISRSGMGLWRLYYREGNARYSLAVERGVVPKEGVEKGSVSWHLPAESFEDRENQEIILYLNLAGSVKTVVEGEKATLFQLGQAVDLCFEERKLRLSFHLTSGHGDFTGQIAYGNRASQKKRFHVGDEMTDQIIAIKTLRRQGDVIITMNYGLQEIS